MIRTKRKDPRPGRLKGADLERLRLECYVRDRGYCVKCSGRVLYYEERFEGDPEAYHMSHIRNKRMWGDVLSNVETTHARCHIQYHAYGPTMGKPCPPK